jgi:hypothetical protein
VRISASFPVQSAQPALVLFACRRLLEGGAPPVVARKLKPRLFSGVPLRSTGSFSLPEVNAEAARESRRKDVTLHTRVY